MTTVLIHSKDPDFANSLAEQVKSELALACDIGETVSAAALIVTTETQKTDYNCPVIHVSTPPVRMAALLAEIRAALQSQAEELALAGGVMLHVRQKQLAFSDKTADVTDKEVQLLQHLAAAGDKGATREILLKTVWGIEFALDTHTLETHIYRLRNKFRELTGDEMIVATDGGYQLK